MLVDPFPADPGLDQLVTTSHQGEGAEVGGQFPAVEAPDRQQRRPEAALLTGGVAVLDVPLFGVLPEGEDQLVDGDWPVGGRVSGCEGGRLLSRGKPLSDKLPVQFFALFGTVFSEIGPLAVDLNQCLATSVVKPVLWSAKSILSKLAE